MLAELIDLIARIYHNRWVFQKHKMRFEFMSSIAKSAFFRPPNGGRKTDR